MSEENNNTETELNPSSDITINEGENNQMESSPVVSKEVPSEPADSPEAVEETQPNKEQGDRKVAKTYSPRTNGGGRKFQMQRNSRFKRRGCRFCQNKNIVIHYRNPEILGRFITDRGKILPRRITGTCARHQRALATSIKRARILALLPFVVK